ncbi:TetR family transcriptional regulator [Nocardia sp. NPDC003482]
MSRWEPNSRGRLEQAALELYRERGFDRTTVSDIAVRAGLTERTFFRHFADKREVLFGGQENLREVLVGTIAEAAESATPLEIVAAAVVAVAEWMQEGRAHALRRREVIVANPSLQERELAKLLTLGSATADALRARGVGDLEAILAAEIGVAVFRVAFERWLDDPSARDFADHVREAFDHLRAVVDA